MPLTFKYCECGCKGSYAEAGSFGYWLYNDLKGNYHLHHGHGFSSRLIKRFKSFRAATNRANRLFQVEARVEMKALKKALRL